MFHFGVDLLYSTTRPQHDLPSLPLAKGEMAISFSWTSFFRSPTSSTLCFGCWIAQPMALLQPIYHLNSHKDNPEVNLSEQSVKECNSSLLLKIDCHHKQ